MTPIVILGGGLAGPVMALSLLKHGIPSEIYEFRPENYTHGGNIALAPNALRVMDHIGVYDTLRSQGFAYDTLAFTNGAGHVLGRFLNGSQKEYNFQAIRIHRSIVRDTIIKACVERGIRIHYNKRCLGVKEENEKGVVLEFEGGEIVNAPFVIGADGIHSRVREYLAPGKKEEYSGLIGIMGQAMEEELGAAAKSIELPCFLYGQNGSFAIMPSNFEGTEIGFFATLEYPDQTRQQWADLENNKKALADLLHERFEGHAWPELVEALCSKVPKETLTSWPFFSAPHLTTYSTSSGTGHGRIVLIGDAAHAIPPFAGQGAAMAFEDCDALGYAISHFTSDGLDVLSAPADARKELLHKWEVHRMARIAKVLDFTTKNGELRKSSPHFYEQAAKEWLFWVLFKVLGPEAGVQWLYTYNAEEVNAALV